MISKVFYKFSIQSHHLSTPNVNVGLLKKFGITQPKIYRNLTVPEYYQFGLSSIPTDPKVGPNTVADNGAFVAFSGKCTGRVPKAKSFVNDPIRQKELGWGDVNKRISSDSFKQLQKQAIDYLNQKDKLFVVDGYAGWDKTDRIKVRIVATRPYHALFMNNMLVKPTLQELETDFANGADYIIFNAGQTTANQNVAGVVGPEAISVNMQQQKMVILGSQYAGEMKKGVFTIMNYLMPKKGHLPLHSSCNVGKDGDVALFFGLSGTGKTALSAVTDRYLIGDDQHVWTNNGVFNIEGGCYAKCIGLDPKKEPQIFAANKFGSVLENIGFIPQTRTVDYNNVKLTENTRVCYPLEFIPNAQIPAVTGHAKNIIFLTCDAFSVLPPVSKLNTAQALYHFYSGYTSKVAGTEVGVKQPQPTFSACFGQAFLPFKPQVYADLLAKKIEEHGTNVWLLNTGWTGGKYGVGSRISLQNTRNILNAIHDGSLAKAEYKTLPIFGLQYPTSIKNVDTKILNPKDSWAKPEQYDQTLQKVSELFKANFHRYDSDASDLVKSGGPK